MRFGMSEFGERLAAASAGTEVPKYRSTGHHDTFVVVTEVTSGLTPIT